MQLGLCCALHSEPKTLYLGSAAAASLQPAPWLAGCMPHLLSWDGAAAVQVARMSDRMQCILLILQPPTASCTLGSRV